MLFTASQAQSTYSALRALEHTDMDLKGPLAAVCASRHNNMMYRPSPSLKKLMHQIRLLMPQISLLNALGKWHDCDLQAT